MENILWEGRRNYVNSEFSSALLLLLVFLLCLFSLHSLHKIIKLVSFWSAWPKDWVYLKLREEILNEVYSHRGGSHGWSQCSDTERLNVWGKRNGVFVQTFNGFHACSRVMNCISPQVLVDKTDSFSLRSIWIQRIRVCSECAVHYTSLTALCIFVCFHFCLREVFPDLPGGT
jgi:hypothetical protein